MQIDYTTRVKAGVIAITLLALLSNYQLLKGWIEFDLSFVGGDDVTSFEKRFEPVKTTLPEHAIVGYRLIESPGTSPDDLRQLYLTQYTLTPRTVVKGSQQDFVLRIGPVIPGPEQDELTTKKYEGGPKVIEFGNGISLIRNGR